MEKLFLGIQGHVVCINKQTGDEIWRTKIKSSTITNVYFEDEYIFAYSGGHLFCLHATEGKVVWENSLKGLGYGSCIMASEQQNSALIASQIAQQTSAVAGGAVAVSAASASS